MKKRFNAFSLMEMMIVLLIISIVIAASAPMVNKKMMTNMAEKTPWVWTNTNGSIAYNLNGSQNQKAIIGGTNVPNNINTRLHIVSTETNNENAGKDEFIPQITLQDKNHNDVFGKFYYENSSWFLGVEDRRSPGAGARLLQLPNNIAIGKDADIGTNKGSTFNRSNIAIGNEATANASESSIAIGYQAGLANDSSVSNDYNGMGQNSIAIGKQAGGVVTVGPPKSSRKQDFVAIGAEVKANDGSVAIGGKKVNDNNVPEEPATLASGKNSVAIGAGAQATAQDSVAIGKDASATVQNSVAIGAGAQASVTNTIVLGDANTTVIIPGNLQVGLDAASTFLAKHYVDGEDGLDYIYMRLQNRIYGITHGNNYEVHVSNPNGISGTEYHTYGFISDRRLKNVGKPFESGLADIKKLEVFNFTFKNDSDNTPHVGVMAQDLQKIFPSAVTKGKDGFLRIRFEDMFFAMVNSIQELSAKIDDIINKEIASLKTRLTDIEEQNRQIVEQFTAFDTKIKTVLDKNAEIETKIQKVADKNAELENQLKEQNALLEKQNKELTEKNAQLEKSVKECAEYKAQIEKRLADLEKKLAE